ncbi:MAG: hypothetical protein IKT27_05720 [Clostridia bacterium]|nr:hypothetical protein [Clostridia bacterium]
MKNNPNQEIHTDYRANDIFKPINANRLAESIHYDFVITQEMLDKFMEQNPGYTTIGIGVLLNSNSDGTKNDTYATLAKAPVSVFIAAKTPSNIVYDFTDSFIATSSSILDISDFMENGQYTVTKTDGVVDVYSEYPYSANITGGVNFHSTPKAPLTVGVVQYNGVIRIGAYKTTGSSPINVFRNGDIKVITQELVSGYGFSDVLTSASQNPSLFVADWMGGGSSGDLGYVISDTDTEVFGLYGRFVESDKLGTRANLLVSSYYGISTYYRSQANALGLIFSNAMDGVNITVHTDGTITKSSTHNNGAIDKVILVDMHKPAIPGLVSTATTIAQCISEYRSGTLSKLDSMYTASNSFDFKGATILDWYTWETIAKEGYNEFVSNDNDELYINADSLSEGIVYEVNVHLMNIDSRRGGDSVVTSTSTEIKPVTPNEPMDVVTSVSRETFDTTHRDKWAMLFCNNYGVVQPLKGWAPPSESVDASPSTKVYIKFSSFTRYGGFDVGNRLRINHDAAIGKVLFFKLNGYIYVLGY